MFAAEYQAYDISAPERSCCALFVSIPPPPHNVLIAEYKLGFVGEIVYFMRDSVSRSAQETFWKKFLKNLQKL